MKTHITLVVDRSGSMWSIVDDANGSIQSFLQEQKELPEDGSTIAIYQFNASFQEAVPPVSLSENINYTIDPSGGTALLDAVGKAMALTVEFVEKEQPEKVIFVIVTDGEENSSSEYKLADIRKAITTQIEKGWEVMYLSSDINAFKDAAKLGVDFGNTHVYRASGEGYKVGTKVMSASLSSSRTS